MSYSLQILFRMTTKKMGQLDDVEKVLNVLYILFLHVTPIPLTIISAFRCS